MKRKLKSLISSIAKLPFQFIYWLFTDRRLSSDGYVLIKSKTGKTKYEHRQIAEEILGRRLKPWEVVHHINGQRDDNTPTNLCVLGAFQHERYHGWYQWIYKTYGNPPRRQTQLRKLREAFKGTLLMDVLNKELALDKDTPQAVGAPFPFHLRVPQKAQFPVRNGNAVEPRKNKIP